MDHEPLFVGRKPELDHWNWVLADPRGQAVLVVGHPGMGKTLLVNKMARLACEHHDFVCGSVRYEVTPNNSAASLMEAMIEDAFQAADSSKPFLSGGTKEQWQGLFNAVGVIPIVGQQLKASAELISSLRRNPRRDTRDEFIERLQLISDRMPDNGRAVFVIDPEKYMQADSDQDWAIVVRKLPDKIKILFAQRPDDVLVGGEQFRGLIAQDQAVRIPGEELGVLDEQALDELIRIRAGEMKRDELELRNAVERYKRHPYAIPAALDLIAAGTPIENLPNDPTPEAIAATQWDKLTQGGATGALGDKAVALFQAYVVLEVPVPDDVVEIVAEIKPRERTALMNDGYLGPLLRMEGQDRRVYHAILADHIRDEMQDKDAELYHRRAVEEFRKRLQHAKQENTAPDALAARRLALHVREVKGPSALALSFVGECAAPLLTLGLLDTMLALSQEALAEVEPDSALAAALYGNLGVIYHMRGDLDQAGQILHKALEIDEKLNQLGGMATNYGNLGLIYQTRGDLDRAEEMHRKSLEIEEKLGGLEGMANQYGNLGVIYDKRGDLDRAEKMHRKSLAIEEKLGRLDGMAGDYGNLGLIYITRGALERAEEMLRKALEINEKLGQLAGMATNYSNLGVIYERRGEADEALRLWTMARDIYEKIGMRHMVEKMQGWLDGLDDPGPASGSDDSPA